VWLLDKPADFGTKPVVTVPDTTKPRPDTGLIVPPPALAKPKPDTLAKPKPDTVTCCSK
jgi:hypothetical protein